MQAGVKKSASIFFRAIKYDINFKQLREKKQSEKFPEGKRSYLRSPKKYKMKHGSLNHCVSMTAYANVLQPVPYGTDTNLCKSKLAQHCAHATVLHVITPLATTRAMTFDYA